MEASWFLSYTVHRYLAINLPALATRSRVKNEKNYAKNSLSPSLLIKRILVFEFITGGGFSQRALPTSLINQAMLMLNALVQELSILPFIQLTVLQDWRCKPLILPKNAKSVWISKDQSIASFLPKLIDENDAIWLIAPETEAILQKISQLVEDQTKILLNSSSQAVAICSDKLRTIQQLKHNAVSIVETVDLDTFSDDFAKPWVVKTKQGVGCLDSYYLATNKELTQLTVKLKPHSNYIIQPYIGGESLSLSCLFKDGKAWLLCCNKQHVSLRLGQFKLLSCDVNINHNQAMRYQQVIKQVAKAIPGLWGYVGIDMIKTEANDVLVLEINPRLTTSYVGISSALGLNVAKLIIEMIERTPKIIVTKNKQITVFNDY